MVKLTKIYTRTGDDGTTGLADGTRRSKHDLRIACYGTIDEANAALGLARAMLDGGSAPSDKASDILSEIVMRLQNDYLTSALIWRRPTQKWKAHCGLRMCR